MTPATLTVTMQSDWIVGSGQNRVGGIDATVQRDADGLPFIPAKSLTGVLRDAAERVASVLDGRSDGPWGEWVTWVFGGQPALGGEPRPARLSIRPARLHAGLRDALLADEELCSAVTFVKPAIAIDERTGTVRPGALRLEERSLAGLRLEAHVELDDTELGSERTEPWDLLTAAAADLKRLGSSRRRGSGRCEVSVDGPLTRPLEVVLDALGEPGPPPDAARPVVDWTSGPPSADGERGAVSIRLRCETPVVVGPVTLGNVRRSLDHVPGRALLPALLGALGHPGSWSTAVRQGAVTVTAALPTIDGRRCEPTPAVLFGPKSGPVEAGTELVSALVEDPPAGTRALRGSFVRFDGEGATLVRPGRTSVSHAVIDDQRQRPTADVGGVYTMEALAAGTELNAVVHAPMTMLDDLGGLAGRRLRLGSSKKDDYGDVLVLDVTPAPMEGQHPGAGSNELVVWLLSDLLLRDARLRPSTDPQVVADALAEALGVAVAPHPDGSVAGGGTSRVEGWRSRWDLPHASLVGLEMGTVLRFRCSDPPDPARLADLERDGLGERRAEGFGRLRVNDPELTGRARYAVRTPAVAKRPPEGATPHDDDQEALEVLAAVALRRRIDAAAAVRAAELAPLVRTPTRTQGGNLRQAAAGLTGPDPQDALRRLRSLAEKLGLSRLRPLLEDRSPEVWDRLGLEAEPQQPAWHRAAREALWPVALQRLLLEALRGAARVEARS